MHIRITPVARLRACLAGALLSLPFAGVAAEVDFSCMKERVRGMPQLSDRYKEYDIILRNHCPGPVYWTLCLERVDPVSHAVVETHTPSDRIEAEARSRVNLQLSRGPEDMGPWRQFQELYVKASYTLDPPARAHCVAADCEAYKREWREQLAAHRSDWKRDLDALAARMEAECPASAWGRTAETEACEARVRRAAQPELEKYATEDHRLQEKLRSAGGPGCRLYAGDPVTP